MSANSTGSAASSSTSATDLGRPVQGETFDDERAVAGAGLLLPRRRGAAALRVHPGGARRAATSPRWRPPSPDGPLTLPGRLTRSARQWTLHLPAGWPWAHLFTMALARLRCIPYPT
jgi:hypothetical protein